MYFVPVKQNKRKKNKQLLKVFLKSVLKVNTVYKSIQELCSTRKGFAQGCSATIVKILEKDLQKNEFPVKMKTYSVQLSTKLDSFVGIFEVFDQIYRTSVL